MIAAVALMLPAQSVAQDGGQTIHSYGRGRVIMKDLTRYEAVDIRFSNDTLSFKDVKSGRDLSVPLTDVEHVSRKKGQTLLGALVGGGFMLGTGLLAVAQVEADPNLRLKDNAGAIVAGLTAGGVVVGALIGSAISAEKTVWEKGRFRVSVAIPLTINASRMGAGVSVARVQVAF
jgi:hypothetical protein